MTSGGAVLVTSRSFSTGSVDIESRLSSSGYDVVRGPVDHNLTDLGPILPHVVAWIAGTSPVTRGQLALLPALRVIARYGVGVEAVDVAAAAEQGVAVTNTPGANSDAVADHALALLLSMTRGLIRGDRAVRSDDWSGWRSHEVGALTVGILGFGRIGQAVARRLSAFGATVLACDPNLDPEAITSLGATPVSAHVLPETCDVVTLHAPGGQTIITREWLDRVRRPVLIINTARSDLVDEGALVAVMRSGTPVSYAADALAGEYGGRRSPLLAHDLADQVMVTPHVAAQTVEAVDRMGTLAVENVLAVMQGRRPPNPVKLPEDQA